MKSLSKIRDTLINIINIMHASQGIALNRAR